MVERIAIDNWDLSEYFKTNEEWVLEALRSQHPISRYITIPLAILAIFMDTYYMLSGYSLELYFLSTTLFLRSLIKESLEEIYKVSLNSQPVSNGYQVVSSDDHISVMSRILFSYWLHPGIGEVSMVETVILYYQWSMYTSNVVLCIRVSGMDMPLSHWAHKNE